MCEHTKTKKVLAHPVSLATTQGIEVSLSSLPYLDVSVRVVPSLQSIYSTGGDMDISSIPGCPIRKSPGQSLIDSSPRLIAAFYVLRRLLASRHPSCALK